jgi:uncharacterized protein
VKFARLGGLVVAALVLLAAPAQAKVVFPPRPAGYVADITGRLKPDTVSRLDADLAQYESRSGNEIGVAVIHSTFSNDISDYSTELFNQWAVGQAGRNNGVLLVIAVDDRRLRLEVGSGLSGVLSDDAAQSIVDREVVPRLKAGDLDGGVEAGVLGARRALGDDTSTPDSYGPGTALEVRKPIAVGSPDSPFDSGPVEVTRYRTRGPDVSDFLSLLVAAGIGLTVVAGVARSLTGFGGGDRCPNCSSLLSHRGFGGPGGYRGWSHQCSGCGFQQQTATGGVWGAMSSLFGSGAAASSSGSSTWGGSDSFGGGSSSGSSSSGSIGGGGSSSGGGASGSW